MQGQPLQWLTTTAIMMSASSSETAVKIEKLNNDNYVTWSANIEQVLKLKNCWEAVCAPPAEV